MIKRDELSDPNSCLNKAENDEPIFVLRGSDPIGAATIRYWRRLAEINGHRQEKLAGANHAALAFDEWPDKKPS